MGLEATDPVFRATIGYLSNLLKGKGVFPDPAERNNRWEISTQLFAAATLARISPADAALDKIWQLWLKVAQSAFVSGKYDAEAEIRAHQELTGASVKDSYLVLNNRYQLTLLGSRAQELLGNLERAIVEWVWHKEDGVGYLEVPLYNLPKCFTAGMLDRWFTSLELLSSFLSWRKYATDLIDWVWSQRNEKGLMGFRTSSKHVGLLSLIRKLAEKGEKTT